MKATPAESVRVEPNPPKSIITDDATASDLLGRADFAQHLASLILDSDDGGSFRIGIYGGWGEGKTSVMKMIEKRIQQDKTQSEIIWLLPWKSQTAQEVRLRLLLDIAGKLGVHDNAWHKIIDTQGGAIANTLSQFGSDLGTTDANLRTQIVANLAAPLIEIGKKKQEENMTQRIKERLGRKRIIIFVDDLDRMRPEILPDFLLHIREALDLPNVYFVLGLSPSIVEQGLNSLHAGWDNARHFLEKIIEYPFYLPELTDEQRIEFVKNVVLSSKSSTIHLPTLEGLISVLPHSPRGIKSFLRYLSGMRQTLIRYYPEDLPLNRLYLCLMLRLEFPEEARNLFSDTEAVKQLGNYADKIYARRNSTTAQGDSTNIEPAAEIKYAPNQISQRERFLKLCEEMKKAHIASGRLSLRDIFILLERAPKVTRKDICEILLDCSPSMSDTEIKVTFKDYLTSDKYAEVLIQICEIRKRLNSELADIKSISRQLDGTSRIHLTTRILLSLLTDDDIPIEKWISFTEWCSIKDCLIEHLHMQRPINIYQSVRAEELQILQQLIRHSQKEILNDIYFELFRTLKFIEMRFDDRTGRLKKQFTYIVGFFERAINDIDNRIVDTTLAQFEVADGISSTQSENSGDRVSAQLVQADSPFHKPTIRTKLREIAGRAHADEIIQHNFAQYFALIVAVATDDSSYLEAEPALKLVRSKTFLRQIWNAAVIAPMNLRFLGEIDEYRNRLLEKSIIKQTDLPLPRWYRQMKTAI